MALVEGATASAREETAQRWRHIDPDWVGSQDAGGALRTLKHIDPEWARSQDATAALPYLVLALAHRNNSCRRIAVQVLESIDPAWWNSEAARSASPALIAAVPSNGAVREHLDRIDAGWKNRELTKRVLIVQLVEGATTTAREKAARLLHHIDPEWTRSQDARAALPYLVPAIAHPEDSRRWIAVQLIESIDPELKSDVARASIATLAEALGSDEKEHRDHAQRVLERIDSEWWKSEAARSAVPELISALPSRRNVREHLDKIDAGWRGCDLAKRLAAQFVSKLEEPPSDPETVLRVLADLGWRPESARHQAYFHFARRDWEQLRRLGKVAIEPLDRACRAGWILDNVACKSSVCLLAELGGADAVDPLLHLLFRRGMEADFRSELSRALHATLPVSSLTRDAVECILVAASGRHDDDKKAPADSDAAIARLCSLDSAVTSNVLRFVTRKEDIHGSSRSSVPLYGDPDAYGERSWIVSHATQRRTAWRELRRRGFPPYDSAAYSKTTLPA